MQDDSTTRVEVRCWRCARLLGVLIDFQGHFERVCKRCKASTVWTGDEHQDRVTSERHTDKHLVWKLGRDTAIRCESCSKGLAFADIKAGCVEVSCKLCKRVTTFYRARTVAADLSSEALMAQMEERWLALFREYSRRRAEVAVGLRFDVFKRDGFRCRYCGRSADDGAVLHADHVVPQSKGGPTTLENLVTACFECNIGKSNKDLGDIRPAI